MVRHHKGFTIFEILAAVVIFSVFSVMMHSIFSTARMNFEMELVRMDLGQEAIRIFRIMEEDIMEGRSLELGGDDLIIYFPNPLTMDDPDNPGQQIPIFGTGPRGNFPEAEIRYEILPPDPLSNLATHQLVRRGMTTGSIATLSNRVDLAETRFTLEGDPDIQDGRRVFIRLGLSEEVFHHRIFYQQVKEVVTRNN